MRKLKMISFNFITNRILCKNFLFFIITITFVVNGFFIYPVFGEEIDVDLNISSGVDYTNGVSSVFSESEITKLRTSDDIRIQSNATTWNIGESYDESQYLEFTFGGGIPLDATISTVYIDNEFRRNGALDGAKLEIWDGVEFHSIDVNTGYINVDTNSMLDITEYLNTPEKINQTKIRFLAYRGEGGNTKTSHDYIGLYVAYEDGVVSNSYTEVSEDISTDTIWTKENSPYVVTSPLYVLQDAKLTIEKGVIIKFKEDAELSVFGNIVFESDDTESIYLTSFEDDTIGGDTNNDGGNTLPERSWNAINIDPFLVIDLNLNNIVSRYSRNGFNISNTILYSDNLNIDEGISISETSGDLHNLNAQFLLFSGGNLSLNNSTLIHNNEENFYNTGISVFGSETYLNINNTNISNFDYGLSISGLSNVVADYLNISCLDVCIDMDQGFLELSNSEISGASDSGIRFNKHINIMPMGVYDSDEDNLLQPQSEVIQYQIILNHNKIFNNGVGISIFTPVVFSGINNSIYNNLYSGFNNEAYVLDYEGFDTEEPYIVNFQNNYWGDPSGPKNTLLNPSGIGNEVSQNINFIPFLTLDPFAEVTGYSNIMFIPGFQASRIYQDKNILGINYTDKLWEPNIGSDLSDLMMDNNGISKEGLYTKDVIDEATVFGIQNMNFYKSFFESLDNMVSNNEINDWEQIPYDWRLSVDDISERGFVDGNNISYIDNLPENSIPYMITKLENLVSSSKTGKVTIVTHSNGGLVSKALINKLIDMKITDNNDLIDHIDNLIMVAAPLLGTPKGMMGILHGYDQGMFLNVLVTRKKARELGQNLPGAYGLIPSLVYFDSVDNHLIYFNDSLNDINSWREKYDYSIDSYEEFKNFLIDLDNIRIQPKKDDLSNPTKLNETILNKAKSLHTKIDDLVIPESIKVYQVAGSGLATPYKLEYTVKNKCSNLLCLSKDKVLSTNILFTTEGDETVVDDSSLYGSNNDYYLDLQMYNKNNPNKNHSNIFEVPQLFDFVENIIKNNSELPNYITKDKIAKYNFSIFKIKSPVSLDIYDESGLHTGLLNDSDIAEEQIPNSLYMEMGDEKYIVVPSDDSYILKLKGLDEGIFTLEQTNIISDGDTEERISFTDIPVSNLFRGEINLSEDSLIEYIKADKDGDNIFEDKIYRDNFINEDKPTRHISVGSYINNNLPIIDQILPLVKITYPIIRENIITEVKNKTKINEFDVEKNNEDNFNLELNKNNDLPALAINSTDIGLKRLKIQVIIVFSYLLLVISLKYIFKVI